MGSKTAIEWTKGDDGSAGATWTPIRARNIKTGKIGWHCEHATTGCEFCYAEGMNKRLGTGLPFKPGHRKDIEIFLDEEMLKAPLHWKKPRKVFVCSMSDLFAEFVQDEWIDRMFAVMVLCPQHTFQCLTKRAERMRAYMSQLTVRANAIAKAAVWLGIWDDPDGISDQVLCAMANKCAPLPNCWLGVSAERQQEADERIPLLLQTPAAVRFISAEPLLGPIDLTRIKVERAYGTFLVDVTIGVSRDHHGHPFSSTIDGRKLDWVIVGGESGPKSRPMHVDWARTVRDQCAVAGTALFFKQWGEHLPVGQSLPGFGKIHGATAVKPGRMKLHYGGTPQQAPQHAFSERGVKFASTADGLLTFRVGKKAAGRLLDGREHNEMPTARF